MFRTALLIARRDLKSRLRDRSVLMIAFGAPLMLAAILSFALGGPTEFTTSYGLAVLDEGQAGEGFAQLVTSADFAEFADVTTYESEDAVTQAVVDGDVAAGWVIPAGFTDTVTSGGQAEVEVLTSADNRTSGSIAESVATGFVAEVNGRGLAVQLSTAEGGPPTIAPSQPLPTAVTLAQADAEEVRDIAGTYFAPAMATFFVFFVVGFGPRSLLRERREGTLPRLLAAPIEPGDVLLGKAIGVFGIGMASMLVMWGVTTALLGADWGDPLGVLGLSITFVLAASALTAWIATLADTEQQVDGYTSVVVFLFALLGGNFLQVSTLPGILGNVDLVTPNGWALRGFTDLISGEPAAAVVGNILAISVFALVFGALALPRIRKVVEP